LIYFESAIIGPVMNPTQPSVDPAPPPESEKLAEAFRIFNQASAELAGTYKTLQSQVAQLTAELAAANGALRQQYQEKAALTERLTLLLNALPAGVVVFDASGRVVEANPAALALGFTAGRSWAELERDFLAATPTPGEYLAGERRLAITVTPLDSAGGHYAAATDASGVATFDAVLSGDVYAAARVPAERLVELLEAADRLRDGLPVGQRAAEPAMVDVVLGRALGRLGDTLGRLALGADEQHAPALRHHVADLDQRLVQQRHRLRQIDDVDVVAHAEDVGRHLRVPAVALVTEVDASLEQLTHIVCGEHGDFLFSGSILRGTL